MHFDSKFFVETAKFLSLLHLLLGLVPPAPAQPPFRCEIWVYGDCFNPPHPICGLGGCLAGCCFGEHAADDRDPYCQFLNEDGPLSWMFPDRLRSGDDRQDHTGRWKDRFCCSGRYEDKRWRIGITHSGAPGGDPAILKDIVTNRLRFEDSVIAQEGLSFCIVGRHYARSTWRYWEPLRGFSTLAQKSFDIGNHIDPEDSGNMNSFTLPNPDVMRSLSKHGVWGATSKWPEHEWQYVWMGQRRDTASACSQPDTREHYYPLEEGFKKRPAHPEYQPDPTCRNPYKVTVTMIETDEKLLHNYLHIKVYSEPTSQPENKNCPSGKFKLLMLEVRDQDGLPVGQFTDDIPCEQDPKTREAPCTSGDGQDACVKLVGSNRNQVPCMFTHPKSAVHPTIFMAAAEPGQGQGGAGGGGAVPGGGGGSGTADACRDSTKPQSERNPPKVSNKVPDSYFTEVHATWRYAQHNVGWVSELHFATMIIEDDTPIQYYTSRKTEWWGVFPCKQTGKVAEYCAFDKPLFPGNEWWVRWCDLHSQPCCWAFNTAPRSPKEGTRCGRMQLALLNTCINSTYNSNRPYGFSARYTAIKPTWRTKGGWGFFHKRFIRPVDVDCHVDIPYGTDYHYTLKDLPGVYSKLPVRRSLRKHLTKWNLNDKNKYDYGKNNVWELSDYHSPGFNKHTQFDNRDHAAYKKKLEWHYHGATPEVAVLKMFRSAHQDPIVLKTEFPNYPAKEYFGSRYLEREYDPAPSPDVTQLQNKQPKEAEVPEMDSHDNEYSLLEMVNVGNTRCPCPFVPTTLPPELQTKRPVEIEGRRSHVVQMLIGWVILVPLSFFVARFYKETFSKVFFLQEFWWYTIHFLCLATTLIFTAGGIYALKIKRTFGPEYEIVWTDATTIHIYFGYGLIVSFILHLLLGAFRAYDMEIRMIQISLHWGLGWLEYAVANVVIMSSMGIPSGILNCTSLVVYIAFLAVQLAFTLGMEVHIRRVDDELALQPPRSYLPTPVMRLFHRDAPHANFRMWILGFFFLVCVAFYAALHLTMDYGSEFACFQPS